MVVNDIEHGCCICVLSDSFIYIGRKISTNNEWLKIVHPRNIRCWWSEKGLLWHAGNGDKDMILDDYEGEIFVPIEKLNHFIPTREELWYAPLG